MQIQTDLVDPDYNIDTPITANLLKIPRKPFLCLLR